MQLERHLNPAQLSATALAGAAILYGTPFLIFLPGHPSPGPYPNFLVFLWARHALILTLLLPLILGGFTTLLPLLALERGIRADRWSADQLASTRTRLNNSWLQAFAYTLCGLGLTVVFGSIFQTVPSTSPHYHPNLGGFSYFMIGPLITLQRIRKALTPPKPIVHTTWRADLKPIQSNHWGQA